MDDLARIFPGATIKEGATSTSIEGPGLRAVYDEDAGILATDEAPISVYGMTLGADGSALTQTPLDEAYCERSNKYFVLCSFDNVQLHLKGCPTELSTDDEGAIPNAELADCTFVELIWLPVLED